MIETLAGATAGVVLTLAAVLAVWAARTGSRRGLRRLVREECVVTLKTGSWFQGIVDVDGPVLVVRHARTAGIGEELLEVDGEIVLERADVDYVQIVSPAVSTSRGGVSSDT